MAETKEDMKITKFKIMIERTQQYLEKKENEDNYDLLSYYPTFIEIVSS